MDATQAYHEQQLGALGIRVQSVLAASELVFAEWEETYTQFGTTAASLEGFMPQYLAIMACPADGMTFEQAGVLANVPNLVLTLRVRGVEQLVSILHNSLVLAARLESASERLRALADKAEDAYAETPDQVAHAAAATSVIFRDSSAGATAARGAASASPASAASGGAGTAQGSVIPPVTEVLAALEASARAASSHSGRLAALAKKAASALAPPAAAALWEKVALSLPAQQSSSQAPASPDADDGKTAEAAGPPA